MTSASNGFREGGCQCGAIRYRFAASAPITLYCCHCTECQKQASSAFGMSLWLRRAELEILSGRPKVWSRKADSGNDMVCAFCPDCGSRLYHAASPDSATVSLKAGSLDDTGWLAPRGHIWTKSAQPWVAEWIATWDHSYAVEPANMEDLFFE